MSKTWEINLSDSGVSVRVQKFKTLYDEEGKPVQVPQGNHRTALAVSSAKDMPQFQKRVAALLVGQFGDNMASVVAKHAKLFEENKLMHTDCDVLYKEIERLTISQQRYHEAATNFREERDTALFGLNQLRERIKEYEKRETVNSEPARLKPDSSST